MKKSTWIVLGILVCLWFWISIVCAIVKDVTATQKDYKSNIGYAKTYNVATTQKESFQTTYKTPDGKIAAIGRQEGDSTIYRNSTGKILFIEQK